VFDTVLIPNRITNNGRNRDVPAVCSSERGYCGCTHNFSSVHTFFEKYGIIILKNVRFRVFDCMK